MNIKQLSHNGETFAPLTIAEAVLVLDGVTIKRLDQVLKQLKVIDSEEIKVEKTPSGIKLLHTNKIEPSSSKTLKKISFDSSGHITDSEDFSMKIGNTDLESLNFGEDFTLENNQIKLKWGDGTIT